VGQKGCIVLSFSKTTSFLLDHSNFPLHDSYLLYRGWIDIRWIEMENATKATLTNVAGQVGHALNNTASQFAAYSATVEAAGLPVAAAFGCMPGLLFGLRKG
jgi:hypothetical protein